MGAIGEIAGDTATGASVGSIIPGVGTAVGAGVGALFGIGKSLYDWNTGKNDKAKAQAQLDALNATPYPKYSVNPALQKSYDQADYLSNQGFSGAEKAAFGQNLAHGSNLAYQRGVALGGGGSSQAIQSGINANNVGAINKFATDDASLHRSNMRYASSLASQLQSISNMQSTSDIARRQAMERAYGGAIAQGKYNQSQALGGASNLGFSLGNLAAYAGKGMGSRVKPPTATAQGTQNYGFDIPANTFSDEDYSGSNYNGNITSTLIE